MAEMILVSSFDSPITAYDSLTGNALAHFSGSRSPRQGLTLAGNNLIAASHVSPDSPNSGSIHLYNWWSSACSQSFSLPEPVLPVVATSDGGYLFSGGLSGRIYAMSLPSGDLCCSFQAHRQPVSCLAINGDGSLLISGGDDGLIFVFPIIRILDCSSDGSDPTQLPLHRFSAHRSAVTSISCGPGGGNLIMVSSSVDGTCKFWSIGDGTHLQTVRLSCPVWSVATDTTKSVVYAGGSDGHVYSILGRKRGTEVVKWEAEPIGVVTAMAMVNGGKNLVSASEEGIIRIWEVETGSIIGAFRNERDGTVSHLVVISGFNRGQIINEAAKFSGTSGGGFSRREMTRKVREAVETEEWLGVVETDRKRAGDMLEASLKNYGRLLKILFKETKGSESKGRMV